jgi:Tfp pilus assembly protein PilO
MNKLSKEKQQQLIIVVVVGIALMAAVYFMVIAGQKDNIRGVQEKEADTQSKIDKAESLIKQRAAIEERLNSRAEALEAIEGKMAQGDLNSWVVTAIGEFKRPFRGDIKNYSPS